MTQKPRKLRLVMMGTGTFAEPTFEAITASNHEIVGLFTQPDRDTGVKRGSTRQTGRGMKEIAIEHQVPVFQPEKIKLPDGLAQLQSLSPDLLVVAAYGQILSKDLLSIPSLGAINVHASLLPKYRGAAPVAWAVYHGEKQTGVTIIRITPGLDAGEMLAQESVEIQEFETAGELETRLGLLGARMARETVDRMAEGPIIGVQQDPTLVTRAIKLKKEDGLIDWSRNAFEVSRQIQAMQPWPTAYTFLHRTDQPVLRLMIQKVQQCLSSDEAAGLPFGHLSVQDGSRLLIAVGNHECLEILELQPAGKKRMTGRDFLRGNTPSLKSRCGNEDALKLC
jgi:methionyl-tRNA formyltransferase